MSKRTTSIARSGEFSIVFFPCLLLSGLLSPAAFAADPWAQVDHLNTESREKHQARASEGNSPWPSVFEDAPASQISSYGCRTQTSMPDAQRMARLSFPAYATEAPETGNGAELLRLAARIATDDSRPLYVIGTSYSPDEKPHRLMSLAISRARSVAQALARYGVDPARLVCVPMAGAKPPEADWDKAVLIFASKP